ncbi:hypothetical protein HK100_010681, partial [Physocladia obscura]
MPTQEPRFNAGSLPSNTISNNITEDEQFDPEGGGNFAMDFGDYDDYNYGNNNNINSINGNGAATYSNDINNYTDGSQPTNTQPLADSYSNGNDSWFNNSDVYPTPDQPTQEQHQLYDDSNFTNLSGQKEQEPSQSTEPLNSYNNGSNHNGQYSYGYSEDNPTVYFPDKPPLVPVLTNIKDINYAPTTSSHPNLASTTGHPMYGSNVVISPSVGNIGVEKGSVVAEPSPTALALPLDSNSSITEQTITTNLVASYKWIVEAFSSR